VRSPPLRGIGHRSWDGLAGKGPGIGDFLGGARSPRPRILAGRKPGHPIPSGWLKMSRWPREHMPRSSAGIPYGRAEPAPPRVRGWRGRVQGDGLAGKGSETTRRAFLSEGPTSARSCGKNSRFESFLSLLMLEKVRNLIRGGLFSMISFGGSFLRLPGRRTSLGGISIKWKASSGSHPSTSMA